MPSPKQTIHILYVSGPYRAHVQNSVSGIYMDAVFKLVAHEESEIWTSLPYRDTSANYGRHDRVMLM